VYALKKLNNVANEAEIQGGTTLVVPRITADAREKNRAKAKAKLHSSGTDQRDGEQMIVPVPDKDAKMAGKKRVFYRVVAGDTTRGVAKAFGVSVADLASWSSLDEDGKLHPKMVLVVWVPTNFDAAKRRVTLLDESQLIVVTRGSLEHMDLAEARTGRVRTEYVAQGKEKLADVAKKFGMGPYDLGRINRIPYNTVLEKGRKIIVYQVADPTRSKRADEQWSKTPRGYRGKVTSPRAVDTASAPKKSDERNDEKASNEKHEPQDHDSSGPVTKPTLPD
jgi:membrane-bound lytic murein transglycosylase D